VVVDGSQLEVHAKCLIEISHHRGRHSTQNRSDALNGHGPDLLGLRLGISSEAGEVGTQQGLKW